MEGCSDTRHKVSLPSLPGVILFLPVGPLIAWPLLQGGLTVDWSCNVIMFLFLATERGVKSPIRAI